MFGCRLSTSSCMKTIFRFFRLISENFPFHYIPSPPASTHSPAVSVLFCSKYCKMTVSIWHFVSAPLIPSLVSESKSWGQQRMKSHNLWWRVPLRRGERGGLVGFHRFWKDYCSGKMDDISDGRLGDKDEVSGGIHLEESKMRVMQKHHLVLGSKVQSFQWKRI